MRRIDRISCVAVLALAASAALPGATLADERAAPDLQERLEAFVGLVPGAAAAVTVRDGVVAMAATGILDDQGGRATPETPFLVGPVGMSMTAVVALQLVDEGLLDLDEPVTSYLPDAPVAEGATVRQLFEWRAGVPDTYGQMIDFTLRDPGRGWTRQELVDLIDPEVAGQAGDVSITIGHAIIAELLVEAVEGKDFGTVLDERLVAPLGLEGTRDVQKDEPLPADLAVGWELDIGLAGDPNVEQAGYQTLDGRATSAVDTARFLQALMAGEIIGQELLEIVFDETALPSSMGFDAHEYALGNALGDAGAVERLGTRYYLSAGGLIAGYTGSLAVSPETGDLVVILTSNDELPAPEFVHQTLIDWAPEGE